MLTHISIRNFKKFGSVDFDLGQSVVLIGPNNSGKTTALQALALWDIGLRHWAAKRGDKSSPEERPGVTINRRDLIAIPIPDANLMWRDLHTRSIVGRGPGQQTQNIRIDITVDGISDGKTWSCGLEFDYANAESLYCRPLRLDDEKPPKRMLVPAEATKVKVAYLPPMSGLAAVEPKWEVGRVNVLVGEGQTAQVLRNLCHQIYEKPAGDPAWSRLTAHIDKLFGVKLMPPSYIKERGEITMAYKDPSGILLDISSSGRGLQQTLLLLAHLYANPGTVLLLDEPDAHLEVLRQRQIYQVLTEVAGSQSSQIVAASHSEVILNEAADRDLVIAFVGKPHRIGGRGSQARKALTDLGFDQYYQAEQTGWVLYLEGSTDLAILQAFAATLGHPAGALLERPFVRYVAGNIPAHAREHFFGLREAKGDLVGIAIFDRLDKDLQSANGLSEMMWRRNEIENYFCMESVLLAYATHDLPYNLFGFAESQVRQHAMRDAIMEVSQALQTLGKPNPWSPDIKATDDFLDPLFKAFFRKLNLSLELRKSDYHILAGLVPSDLLDAETTEKLDAIVAVAEKARPRTE